MHVIIGEDDYLVSEAARQIVGDGVGLETIDSLNSTKEELQLADIREADASLMTPPFLDPRKVTWWRNVGFLPQAGKGGSTETVKAALEKFAAKLAAARLPEEQHFILSGPRLLQSSTVAKTLKASVEMVVFAAEKPWQRAQSAVVRAIDLAQEAGLAFAHGAAEVFVARVGTDARSLAGEVAKMRDYLGPDRRTITAADVAEVSSQGVGVEPEIWSITDAIGGRDVAKAVDAVRRFEGENGFAVLVTTVVEKFFRQLVELKDAEAGGRFGDATEGMNPYAAKKARAFLGRWTLNELRVARARFVELRERAVASQSVDDLVVARIVQVCAGRRAR
ncbi:MAG: hypothetical protein IJ829_03855 [Kiritimatiellae bacterium]|nr:hypothetical protein [Kiritimatiellia bacterium]